MSCYGRLLVFCCVMLAWPSIPVASAAPAAEVARLGFYIKIARDLNRAEVRSALELWTQELTRNFQVPAEVTFYSDIDALHRDFDTGRINLVIADAMTFVRNFKPDELAEGFTTQLHNDASLMLMAPPGLSNRSDLLGKRVALLADDEISSTYLETLCMRQYGRHCAQVLAGIQRVGSNHQAITRLFFKQVDLALVNSHGLELALELNPQLRKAGEVANMLAFETQFFGFFSGKVNAGFRQRSLATIAAVHLQPRGRMLLDVFKTEQLALADPSVLKPFYHLEKEYRELEMNVSRKGKR